MSNKKTLESGLMGQEELLASALKSRDADALDRMLAPDYWFTSAHGESWGRDRAIAEVRAPTFSLRHVDVRVDQVRAWGDAGVVVGRSEILAESGTQCLSGRFRFTHVWRRREGRWQLVAGHTSREADSEGSPRSFLPGSRLCGERSR